MMPLFLAFDPKSEEGKDVGLYVPLYNGSNQMEISGKQVEISRH